MDNEKLELKTEDIVTSNIDKIAALFPNCVTEGIELSPFPVGWFSRPFVRHAPYLPIFHIFGAQGGI